MLGGIGGALWLSYSLIGPPAKHSWHLTLAVFCLICLGLAGWARLLSATRLNQPLTVLTLALLVGGAALLPTGAQTEAIRLKDGENYRDRVWSY